MLIFFVRSLIRVPSPSLQQVKYPRSTMPPYLLASCDANHVMRGGAAGAIGDAAARAGGGQLIRHRIALLRHSGDAREEEEEEEGPREEDGFACSVGRIHIPPRAAAAAAGRAARSVGRSVESILKEGERPSSKKWPRKKYGPRGTSRRRRVLRG